MLAGLTSLLGGWRLYALAGLAGVLLSVGLYQAGINAERRRGEAAQLRVEIETMQADKALAEKARLAERAAAAELERENQLNEEALDALTKRLAALPQGDQLPAAGPDLDELYP